MRFDFYPNKPGVWTSYIDGTVSGGQDGTQQWYDYYDNDTIQLLNWQTDGELVQPNEYGVSCVVMYYYGEDSTRNGLGDIPCKAIASDPMAHCASTVRIL